MPGEVGAAAENAVEAGAKLPATARRGVEAVRFQIGYVRLSGSGRYAPGQTEAGALRDMRPELDAL